MREMHWHPNNDEWQYDIEGDARMTVFAGEGKARTFNYHAGDVGYVPFAMGHYVENIGGVPGTLPRNVQKRPARRDVAEPMDGVDPARVGAGPPSSEP